MRGRRQRLRGAGGRLAPACWRPPAHPPPRLASASPPSGCTPTTRWGCTTSWRPPSAPAPTSSSGARRPEHPGAARITTSAAAVRRPRAPGLHRTTAPVPAGGALLQRQLRRQVGRSSQQASVTSQSPGMAAWGMGRGAPTCRWWGWAGPACAGAAAGAAVCRVRRRQWARACGGRRLGARGGGAQIPGSSTPNSSTVLGCVVRPHCGRPAVPRAMGP